MKEQFLKLKKFLDDNITEYKVMEHEPVYTSEEAAKVRGVELKSGVKALVLKTNEDAYLLALVSADKKIDLKLLAGIIGTKKLSFASPDKVLEITGCEIGSVHPFGNVHNLTTYMDPGISGKEMIKLIKPKIVKLSRNS